MSEKTITAAANALTGHLPESAYETGCRLSCGYDGSDLDIHLASVVVAAIGPLIREQIREEIISEMIRSHLAHGPNPHDDGFDEGLAAAADLIRGDHG